MTRAMMSLAWLRTSFLVCTSGALTLQSQPSVIGPPATMFEGSSPCGARVREELAIPGDANCELVRWQLFLIGERQLQVTGASAPAPTMAGPLPYTLRVEYGPIAQGVPGLAQGARALARSGAWTREEDAGAMARAAILKLDYGVALRQIDANVLHLLDEDGSLMVGDGGWSYTLNRAGSAEPTGDPSLALRQPDMSYRITPLAAGPAVFGVFEGRTPCRGIARDLGVRVPASCTKAKWRVTLFQDPATLAPTTYRLEGTMARRAAREGRWERVRGIPGDPDAVVYRLEQTPRQPAILLLRGDENVLFFLDADRALRVGHADFSYTLNRRTGTT